MTEQDAEQDAAQAIEAGQYDEAVRLLLPLAEQHSEYALLALGWICETGAAGVADLAAARDYYRRAVAEGSARAYLHLGWILWEEGDEAGAREAFGAGARMGDEESECALRRLDGHRVEWLAARAIEAERYEEAARLLQPLADRGSEYALLTLGWIRETGAAGVADKGAARAYYERAIAEGSASAHYDLGRILLAEGEESPARSAFQAGAERGYAPCMSLLGKMMAEGRGGAPDLEGGSALLQAAAAQGNLWAQRTLVAIEARASGSLFAKLRLGMRIVSLAGKGVKEMWKDRYSDKLR